MNGFEPVLDAARRRSAALVNKDIDALTALLHPQFLYVNSSGQVLDRAQYFDVYVLPENVQWTKQDIHQPKITGTDQAAVLTCLVHDVFSFKDHDLDTTFRSTLMWLHTEEGWRCLGGQTSQIL